MNLLRTSALFVLAVCLPIEAASACPDGESANFLGWCVPNQDKVIDIVLKPGTEAWAQFYGPQIGAWFEASRATAYSASEPIPSYIRSKLNGFVSDDVLNRARYKVGDNGVFNAAADILKVNQDIAAVALVDVIVFRDGNDAQSNLKLWAHELKHVRQFMEWGSRDFGIRYARNYNGVEGQAREEEARYETWASAQQTGPYPQMPSSQAMAVAKVCVTPYMVCTMSAVGPVGQSCYCPTQFGPLYGQSM